MLQKFQVCLPVKVENLLTNRLICWKNAVGNILENMCVFVGKACGFATWFVRLAPGIEYKWCSASTIPGRASTSFAQLLRIQTILDFGDCGPDIGIKSRFFFDFFYRVNGRRVVFAAQFAGNLREAEV